MNISVIFFLFFVTFCYKWYCCEIDAIAAIRRQQSGNKFCLIAASISLETQVVDMFSGNSGNNF